MEDLEIRLPEGKRLYFASDFHLGVPDARSSRERELKLCRWLDSISHDAHTVFLMGDVFDFWFEYRKVIPKGFLRFQGKLAELADRGIDLVFFHGNHDMWMFDYFRKELGARIYSDPVRLRIGDTVMLIGHGDGLGPGDHSYKFLRKVFRNKLCIWLFSILPPAFGMGIAHNWSKHSRITNSVDGDGFKEDSEFLLIWCREQEATAHHDYYIFGHRHLVIDFPLSDKSRYLNLGEWVNSSTYGVYDGRKMVLRDFEA